MALELTMDETRLVARPVTEALGAPVVSRPHYFDEEADTSTEITLEADAPRSIDGVRILDAIAPLQMSRFYELSLSSRLDVLQSWEGAVTEIDEERGTFTARLMDLDNPAAAVSEAEFDLSDVSANDCDALRIGGIFRWMIGYRRHNFGQRERVSAIVFRRLPVWNEADVEEAVIEGERLAGSIRPR